MIAYATSSLQKLHYTCTMTPCQEFCTATVFDMKYMYTTAERQLEGVGVGGVHVYIYLEESGLDVLIIHELREDEELLPQKLVREIDLDKKCHSLIRPA